MYWSKNYSNNEIFPSVHIYICVTLTSNICSLYSSGKVKKKILSEILPQSDFKVMIKSHSKAGFQASFSL